MLLPPVFMFGQLLQTRVIGLSRSASLSATEFRWDTGDQARLSSIGPGNFCFHHRPAGFAARLQPALNSVMVFLQAMVFQRRHDMLRPDGRKIGQLTRLVQCYSAGFAFDESSFIISTTIKPRMVAWLPKFKEECAMKFLLALPFLYRLLHSRTRNPIPATRLQHNL